MIGNYLGVDGVEHKLRKSDTMYDKYTGHQKILQLRLSAVSTLALHLTIRYDRHEV